MAKTDFKSVSEYIASRPKHTQAALKQVRAAIQKAVPEAEEGISYQIPVYKLKGVMVIYFAGWKEHFSLYPAKEDLVAQFKKELAGYELSKGTIRFPFSDGVPTKLIERLAKFRVKQLKTRDQGKGSRKTGREAQLVRLRGICATMPSVSEKLSHGAPSFFVKKDKGVFATFADDHHADGHLAVWLPAPPGLQSALIEDAPETYFRPPYVGPSGWIGIELNRVSDEALEIHVRQAWEIAAGKSKRKT